MCPAALTTGPIMDPKRSAGAEAPALTACTTTARQESDAQRDFVPGLDGMSAANDGQARQESNLQPPVLETGALPIELRTYRLDAQTHGRVDAQNNPTTRHLITICRVCCVC